MNDYLERSYFSHTTRISNKCVGNGASQISVAHTEVKVPVAGSYMKSLPLARISEQKIAKAYKVVKFLSNCTHGL